MSCFNTNEVKDERLKSYLRITPVHCSLSKREVHYLRHLPRMLSTSKWWYNLIYQETVAAFISKIHVTQAETRFIIIYLDKIEAKRKYMKPNKYLMPGVSFNLREPKISIIGIHTSDFLSSWSAQNLKKIYIYNLLQINNSFAYLCSNFNTIVRSRL